MSQPNTSMNHRATVCLTVDFDAVALWMQWGARGARSLSRGEFGARVGAPRLLELLERQSVKTTWFIPGHTAETFPAITASIAERGHEIGNHGYLHEPFDQLDREDARVLLRKANDALVRVTGQEPSGFRLPAGDCGGYLFEVLIEEGFSYDSSLMGDDFNLYWCRSEDVIRDDGPNEFGEAIDLVEAPVSLVMNDFHHFEFNYGSPLLVGHDAPEHVGGIWRRQFDYMYKNCIGGVLTLMVHPQCIGQGLRLAMLEEVIEDMKCRRDVRFAKLGTIVTEFRQEAKKLDQIVGSRQ